MNTAQDAPTQGVVSDFTTDTKRRNPSAPPLFYNDQSFRVLTRYGPAFVNVFYRDAEFGPTHVNGAAHQSREIADRLHKPMRHLIGKPAYRIVVRQKVSR